MCDGSLNEKIAVIRELMKIERPGEYDGYLYNHLTWTIEELRARRNEVARRKHPVE